MDKKILGLAALALALSTLVLPFMAVGEITTGAFVGVVKKPALVVFAAPALLAGLLAGLGGLLGFGKGRSVAAIVLGILAIGVSSLLFAKLKSGASIGPGMLTMAAAAIAAVLAGVRGLSRPAAVS